MPLGSIEMLAEKSKVFNQASNNIDSRSEDDEKYKLSFAFQNLNEINQKLIPTNCEKIVILDLTENNLNGLNDLKFLIEFLSLKTLILDKNQIQSNIRLPLMKNLTTLWVNHNKIENLSIFIQNIQNSCPNLLYLSMMNNKAAPSYFNGGSLIEYNDYRFYVISKLLNLKILDYKEITPEERIQSQNIYGMDRNRKAKENSNELRSKLTISKDITQYKPNKDENEKTEKTRRKSTKLDKKQITNSSKESEESLSSILPDLHNVSSKKLEQNLEENFDLEKELIKIIDTENKDLSTSNNQKVNLSSLSLPDLESLPELDSNF